MPVVQADAGTSAAAPVTPESPRVSPPPGACAALLSPPGRKQQCQPAPPHSPAKSPLWYPKLKEATSQGCFMCLYSRSVSTWVPAEATGHREGSQRGSDRSQHRGSKPAGPAASGFPPAATSCEAPSVRSACWGSGNRGKTQGARSDPTLFQENVEPQQVTGR